MTVDFHSHILPNVDDGSSSLEETVAMLRMEAAQGITHVVATPHFYAHRDTPERFLERRGRAEELLDRERAGLEGLPELRVGAEVAFFRGMSQSELLPQLTVRGTNCLLVEMPFTSWTDEMYRELDEIWRMRGITPVVAHVDRYIGPFRTNHVPRRLAELPVLVQANAEFFLRRSTAGMAFRMLKHGQIQLLGSDCHNMSSRKPNLGDALTRIREKLGPEAMEKLQSCGERILEIPIKEGM